MRAWGIGSKVVFTAGWVVSLILTSQIAMAAPTSSKHRVKATTPAHSKNAVKAGHSTKSRQAHSVFPAGNVSQKNRKAQKGKRLAAYRGPTLQCVSYARAASDISLSGNAADWWSNAAGVYARGNRPQPGSVLAFTSNGRMPLGHVAVVDRVINAREITVDHANWAGYRGAVARGVPVVDVSANNDWTAVRVATPGQGDFGSVYPTHGFIYERPDNGVRVAPSTRPAPVLALSPAPSDLRPGFGRQSFPAQAYSFDEVAEAPTNPRKFDRPDRSLR